MTVADIARKYGGECTWTFSQSLFTSPSTWLRYRDLSWKGICAALSTHWIREHAHDGSLASSLGGGNVGALNVGTIRNIGMMQKIGNESASQENTLALWLKTQNVIPIGSTAAYPMRRMQDNLSEPFKAGNAATYRGVAKSSRADVSGTEIVDVAAGLVKAIRAVKGKSFYAYITFGGTGYGQPAGHAVAAYVGAPSFGSSGDVAFFDPNYGEYWFKRKIDFLDFFPEFFRESYLSNGMKFNKRWSMQPLGHAMGFAQ